MCVCGGGGGGGGGEGDESVSLMTLHELTGKQPIMLL